MKKYKPYGLILGSILIIYFILGILVKLNGFYYPDYARLDLTPVLSKEQFNEQDYALLFEQTGLGKPIIDELKKTEDFTSRIVTFQDNYFKETKPVRTNMNILTRMDEVQDEQGNWTQAFDLAPYKNGDIFLSKSTYTANWRHGHAGIVVDAVRGKLLESLEPFTLSMEQDAAKWQFYPTFKMMRLKDSTSNQMDEIADFAKENLSGLPYNILAMKNQNKGYTSTQCSLLVWQAFKAFGIDLDSTGGIFVSPQDIAKSPLLETLQIYGFNPNKDW